MVRFFFLPVDRRAFVRRKYSKIRVQTKIKPLVSTIHAHGSNVIDCDLLINGFKTMYSYIYSTIDVKSGGRSAVQHTSLTRYSRIPHPGTFFITFYIYGPSNCNFELVPVVLVGKQLYAIHCNSSPSSTK